MLGDISDEEANELIALMSESVRENMLNRDIVESRIFPVSHYVNVACYILYEGESSFQYQILKRIADKITPEEMARRSKSLGSPLNQLIFYSMAMLYLNGRGQVIHDNLWRRKKGEINLFIEPEEKKKELKFVLDFWRRLSPNYRNDGALTTESKTIQILSNDYINNLKDQMIPIDNNIDLSKKLKRTIAHLSIYNFLFQAECRIGIFEHGPYYFESNPDPLIFKEFQYLYTGDELFGINVSSLIPQKITKPAPISNIIFGMTLKNMNKIEFNDWGTLFAEPNDFSSNITSIGIWTKEIIHPKHLRYPDKLSNLRVLSPDILDDMISFAQNATKEMYIDYSKWSYIKKLMLGTSVYVNFCNMMCTAYAGIENEFNWTWALDYAEDKPFKSNLIPSRERLKDFIEKLEKWGGLHPFVKRIARSVRKRKEDPYYYYLQD